MTGKTCKCGCGYVLSSDSTKDYKWGHTPKATASPNTALALPEGPLEIVAPASEYIDCQLHISQVDRIYRLLSPEARVVAALNGLNHDIDSDTE
jgi:hypothetical protein